MERVNAGAAIFTVFKKRGDKDQYCMANKFASHNLDDYVNWSDIEIASLNLGWPVAPEGGAKKHN